MTSLLQAYTFSKMKNTTFTLIRCPVQNIDPTKIERHRRKQEQESVNEGERQGLRGLIGSLQYAATNTRPDTAARLSLLQSKINCAKIADLLDANRLLGDAKKHSDSRITISSIPEEQIRIVAYSDASFATREKQQSQKGSLISWLHMKMSFAKGSQMLIHCLCHQRKLTAWWRAHWLPRHLPYLIL